MKALVLAALISGGMTVGPNTTQRFMSQREGEPLVHVESWNTITCADASKSVNIRLLANEKTISVTCD